MSKRNDKSHAARKNTDSAGGHAARNALLGTVAAAGIAGAVRYVTKHRGTNVDAPKPSALVDKAADAASAKPGGGGIGSVSKPTNAGPARSMDAASVKSLGEPLHHS